MKNHSLLISNEKKKRDGNFHYVKINLLKFCICNCFIFIKSNVIRAKKIMFGPFVMFLRV